MQFILKQGKQAEEQQKRKHVGGDGPVWQPHALYVVVAGGSWVGLRGNLKIRRSESSALTGKTETASQEESPEMGKSDYADTISGNVDASDTQENESNVLNEDKKETESSQDSAGTEEDASASTGDACTECGYKSAGSDTNIPESKIDK